MPELIARVGAVLDSLPGGPHEIVLVDDGSRDRTFELVREAAVHDSRIVGLRLSRNFGHQAALTATLPRHEPQGFTALIVAITFFAGVQLLFLGLIGEYLGRVYDEAKSRPHFVIADVVRDGVSTDASPDISSYEPAARGR